MGVPDSASSRSVFTVKKPLPLGAVPQRIPAVTPPSAAAATELNAGSNASALTKLLPLRSAPAVLPS